MPFTLWIDADACPKGVRDLLELTAMRRRVRAVFVANTYMNVFRSEFIQFQLVSQGADKADDYIVENSGGDDIAVTADIPLAARLVEKGIFVLDPRGEEVTAATIGDRLAMRNLMEELRGAGLASGGPKEMDKRDGQRFANALDRAVTKRLKK
jgi:uncharacterized protein YaiI (UPF0178 family)